MSVYITKADGEHEPFDSSKLVASLTHAGAALPVAQAVAHDIERQIWSGISTREIYSRAFALLREHKHVLAARYSLKRSLMEFGPSGFPFEVYIAELFRAEGLRTEVDQIIKGACVEHEVDVVVHKEKETIYAEAKFHNTVGFKTDLKTVLYVSARIMDIREAQKNNTDTSPKIVTGLVVTNTKFTDKAVEYAQCQGLQLLGWDNPEGHTLSDKIHEHALYPVTALTTLTNREKMALLSKKVVLCGAIADHSATLREAGITPSRVQVILEEAEALCIPEKDIL